MIAILFSGQVANFLIALLYHQTLKEDIKRCTAIKEEPISLELKGFSIYLWQLTSLQNQKLYTKFELHYYLWSWLPKVSPIGLEFRLSSFLCWHFVFS